MKSIRHKKILNDELVLTIKDICLEIQDIGFRVYVENIQDYTNSSFCKIQINHKSLFKGSDISEVLERVYYFMKQNNWRMWVDAHLYNDYHYNNGYLSFFYLLPGHSNNEYKNKLEDYFDIFRYQYNEEGRGIKSIVIHFEKSSSGT